jgi:hypothetical protein
MSPVEQDDAYEDRLVILEQLGILRKMRWSMMGSLTK